MIVGMLRVKNEGRWIRRCLESIYQLCDVIWVLDDHSEDDTIAQCKSFLRVYVVPSHYKGLDEARDKNFLLETITNLYQPEWIISIDGDEMLVPGHLEALREAMHKNANCLSLKIAYLWDSEHQIRIDGVYGDFHRESIFRPNGATFSHTTNGANFHCGNVPTPIRQRRTVLDIPLLHFGYMHREDRIRKYNWYNAMDPKNTREDEYRHMVIGDIFPADSNFAHGGPLKLARF